MKIICPSRKRSKIMTTNINNMIILVAENEKEDYKDVGFDVITHDNLSNLARIRQYAYEKFKDVFFVDDDIEGVFNLYDIQDNKLTPEGIEKLIYNTCYQAKQLGCSLYGFNNDPSPTHYNQHKPFMFNGYINGCAFGLNEDENLYFDARTTACESHWINLLNAYHNRYCFIDKRFHFRQKSGSTFTLEGGQTGKRTLSSERYDTLFLRRKFGESVQIKKEQNKTKQLHEYQRVLNIKL